MDVLALLLCAILMALQLVMLAALLRRLPPARSGAPAAEMRAEMDTDPPTALAVLRHAHRFGPKDGDGVRYCRCGDRYLDGMRI